MGLLWTTLGLLWGYSGPLWVTVPGQNSHQPQAPSCPGWGGAAGTAPPGPEQGQPRSPGQAELPGGGAQLRCSHSCPDWAGESPTWPYTGTERDGPMGPGFLPPSAPGTIQGVVCSQPGDLGFPSVFGGHGGTQGGAGDPLEPGKRDRDKSLLSPSLLTEFPVLSWSISLGK